MNPKINPTFQAIGNALLDISGDSAHTVLGYAEVEESVSSVNVFYSDGEGLTPKYKYGRGKLAELFYELWENWVEPSRKDKWRSAHYIIQGGRAHMQLIYPDAFDEDEDEFKRRDSVVRRYFGTDAIDYSNPD
jgi:hypothetical protein